MTPFDRREIYEATLARLVEFAQKPGWKAWAWHEAKQRDADPSGLFRGIAADLKSAMADRKQQENAAAETKNTIDK